ncbi:hypothetical protein [Hymenobacter defluvii]|uniref:hypothetical protein n=1 Tax=Hymenobacter defluvii TaxID=2054411 RepID=UPI001AAE7874|nr:hypothetical protein [Hymenobacter defluvii]
MSHAATTALRPCTVVAGFYDDGATFIAHVQATSADHAAQLAQIKVHGDKMQAGDILDSELEPLEPGEVPDILYMIAIFEGHHTNLYVGPAQD